MDDNNTSDDYWPEWPEPLDSFFNDNDPPFFDVNGNNDCLFSQLWFSEFEITGPPATSNINMHPHIFGPHLPQNKKDAPIGGSHIEFKYGFYKILSNKKRFKKQYVIKIHNRFLVPMLGFPPVKREEYRSIDKYFIRYQNEKEKIYKCLRENKDKIKNEFFSEKENKK